MSSAPVDHVAVGLGRVALQYQNSPRFLGWLTALLTPFNELESVLQVLSQQFDIDLAEGVNLDVIGDIVGAPRLVPKAIPLKFFGFLSQPGALTFGEEGQPSIGGRWREDAEVDTATSVLSDPEYRLLIKARIVKNHSRGTGEDVLRGLSFLFDVQGVTVPVGVTDSGGMAFQISVGRLLSYTEQILISTLDILPRPAGARISHRVAYDATNYFGFADQLGALTFGEEGSATAGGQFAEEF
jgi:Protein of unknown function (DUF2612)